MQEELLMNIGAKVAVNAFTDIFRTCFKGFRRAGAWAIEQNKELDFFGLAAQQYTERIEQRYSEIRIFGMSNPINLRDIYTRVRILDRITATQRSTVEDLEKDFDHERREFGISRKTRDGIDVVNRTPRLVVQGKPGAGKSTFLKYVALQAADGVLAKKRIPIFVSLRDLSTSNELLTNFIVEQFDICRFPEAEPFIQRVLEQGKCIVLLDGLDEVDKSRENEIIKQIRAFSDKYNENHYILSSRIASHSYCFEKFTDIEMADFDDMQIEMFVNNWFGRDSIKASLCLASLKDDKSVRELASIPLLLTLLCIAFDEAMGFPSNKAELYEEALGALLKKWDASRSIKREDIYKNLSTRRKESLFGKVAYITFEKNRYFFSQRILEKFIAEFIRNLPEAVEDNLELDSEAVLKSIEAQHGLFVERARGIYSFSHLTFHEYFAAKYLVDNAAKGTLENLVKNHLTDERWSEVFLITTGMLQEADAFLLLIKEKVDSLVVGKRAAMLLKIVQNFIKNQQTLCFLLANSGVTLAAARALDLAFIIGYSRIQAVNQSPKLPIEHHLAFALARDLSRDLALTLTRNGTLEEFLARGFDRALERGHSRNIARTIGRGGATGQLGGPDMDYNRVHTSDLAVDLTEVLDFSEQYDLRFDERFLNDLVIYLRANHLLAKCLLTECYISKETRIKILNEMLII